MPVMFFGLESQLPGNEIPTRCGVILCRAEESGLSAGVVFIVPSHYLGRKALVGEGWFTVSCFVKEASILAILSSMLARELASVS